MRAASYRVIQSSPTIMIEDLDGPLSVTNDAEAVVEKLLERYGDKRIFYYDTQGELSELTHDGERFTGFKGC